MLAKHTGQPLSKIEKDVERDFYMSAEEAKKYGIIDEIMKGKGNSKIKLAALRCGACGGKPPFGAFRRTPPTRIYPLFANKIRHAARVVILSNHPIIRNKPFSSFSNYSALPWSPEHQRKKIGLTTPCFRNCNRMREMNNTIVFFSFIELSRLILICAHNLISEAGTASYEHKISTVSRGICRTHWHRVWLFLRFIISLGKRGSMELEIKQMTLTAKEDARRITEEADKKSAEVLGKIHSEEKEREGQWKRTEERLIKKEELLDKRQFDIDAQAEGIKRKVAEVEISREKAEELNAKKREELERVANLSREDAKKVLLEGNRKAVR